MPGSVVSTGCVADTCGFLCGSLPWPSRAARRRARSSRSPQKCAGPSNVGETAGGASIVGHSCQRSTATIKAAATHGRHVPVNAFDPHVQLPLVPRALRRRRADRPGFVLMLLVLSRGERELRARAGPPALRHALVVLLVLLAAHLADVLEDVVAAAALEPTGRLPLDPRLNAGEALAVGADPVRVEPSARVPLVLKRRVHEDGVIVQRAALLKLGPPKVPLVW